MCGKIDRRAAYAALEGGRSDGACVVTGARLEDQPRRFGRAHPYQPDSRHRFRFDDGLELRGPDAADRVRATGLVAKLVGGTMPIALE